MDYKQMQELMQLQQKAQKIKEELGNTHIEAEMDGVVVTVSGELEVVSVQIIDTTLLAPTSKERLEKAIKDASNKGLKKAQEIAADKMKEVMSGMGMNLPGMA